MAAMAGSVRQAQPVPRAKNTHCMGFNIFLPEALFCIAFASRGVEFDNCIRLSVKEFIMARALPVRHSGQVATASGLDILAGIWLIISPFFLAYNSAGRATSNDVILGIIIAIIAAVRFFGAYEQAWLSWINVLLGIWVLISPWALGYSNVAAPLWNNVILGIIVIILAAWSALATDTADVTTTTTGTDDYRNPV